jgi:hypothetical protein
MPRAEKRAVTSEESLGYAAKSSTLAVGAEKETGGSVASKVSLGGTGYEDEHSSF